MKVDNLPEDLIVGILAKLPVKPLIRFKCVSKYWYNLIESPSFIDMHLKRSNASKHDRKDHLFFLNHDSRLGRKVITFFSYYTSNMSLNLSTKNPNIPYEDFAIEIAGSCNGLLCLLTRKDHYVMNPATRESKKLAREPQPSYASRYGFGYDPKSNDYKLVRVEVSSLEPVRTIKAELLTLKNNSWRWVDSVLEGVHMNEVWSRAVVNNAVHWYATLEDKVEKLLIVGFDLVNEVFRDIIRIPACLEQYRKNFNHFYRCCVSNGFLSMAVTFGEKNDPLKVELWVMKEYGDEGSWARQYCVTLSPTMYPVGCLTRLAFGVGFHGQPLLCCCNRVLIMCPSSGEYSGVDCAGYITLYPGKVTNYRESLVRIESSNQLS